MVDHNGRPPRSTKVVGGTTMVDHDGSWRYSRHGGHTGDMLVKCLSESMAVLTRRLAGTIVEWDGIRV